MHLFALLSITAWVAVGVQAQQPPKVKLPWGTWEALPSNNSFWHIPNVRFGRDTAQTRFQRSLSPSPISNPNTVMDPTYGPACIQIPLESVSSPKLGSPIPIPNPPTGPAPPGEDCLFLDIYIPKSVNVNQPTTQVVVWIYGGAFIFGSKGGDPGDELGPFYTGQGLIEAIQKLGLRGNVIFVAGNYRLGAFGWLAGPTVQSYGLPNAGLSDQSLLLEWVQKYIGQVGGNNTAVSVWGESAGASSIMHHLVAQDNKPLLFNSALLQSPAFEWQWDNTTNGQMQRNFNSFAIYARCGLGDNKAKFDCLQRADVGLLANASKAVYDSFQKRYLYPWGPAVDNTYQYLPPVALTYNLSKPLRRLVVSHVFNESGTFTPPHTTTDQNYTNYVYDFIPQSYNRGVAQAIIDRYPVKPYGNQFNRLAATIANVSFTCNTRFLYDRYRNALNIPVWMMQYSVGSFLDPTTLDLARHASDLIPTFWYPQWNLTAFIEKEYPAINQTYVPVAVKAITKAAGEYQAYLASYAVLGFPGNGYGFNKLTWNVASNNSNFVTNVMNFWEDFEDSNNTYADPQNKASDCNFWADQALELQRNTWNNGGRGGGLGSDTGGSQQTLELQDEHDFEL